MSRTYNEFFELPDIPALPGICLTCGAAVYAAQWDRHIQWHWKRPRYEPTTYREPS